MREYKKKVGELQKELGRQKEQAASVKKQYLDWNRKLQDMLNQLRSEKASWTQGAAAMRSAEKEAKVCGRCWFQFLVADGGLDCDEQRRWRLVRRCCRRRVHSNFCQRLLHRKSKAAVTPQTLITIAMSSKLLIHLAFRPGSRALFNFSIASASQPLGKGLGKLSIALRDVARC